MNAPPYRIPDVAEIAAMAGSNGLVAATTFAGCGGSSTGYRWAGYDVRWANEFLPAAADAYEANWPGTTVDRRDVRDVTGAEILAACRVDEVDLFDGSPPCQPFSMAGKRERNWRREVDHSDGTRNRGGSEDLVGEWLRLAVETRARVAVMENVRGLTAGKAKGYLLDVLDALRAAGYRAAVRLLDAQWLGVPQRRVRAYVVAVRGDLGLEPAFPSPLPYRYSIADALPWLAGRGDSIVADPRGQYAPLEGKADGGVSPTIRGTSPTHYSVVRKGAGLISDVVSGADEPAPAVLASHHHSVRVVDTQRGHGFVPADVDPRGPATTIMASGVDQFEVHGPPPPAWMENRETAGFGKTDRYRPDRDPAPTITSGGTGTNTVHGGAPPPRDASDLLVYGGSVPVTGPSPTVMATPLKDHQFHGIGVPVDGGTRKLTIPEVKRLMGFPDDYLLPGKFTEQWARLGNAVPPPMARAVGLAAAALLDEGRK